MVEAAARHRRLRRTCEQTMSRRSSESSTGQHHSVPAPWPLPPRARADGPASAVPQESKSAAAISMRLIMCLCTRHGRGHQGRACHDIARGSGNLLTISGNLAKGTDRLSQKGTRTGIAGGRASVQHEEWSAGAPTRAVHVRWGEGACARALPLGSSSPLRCLFVRGLIQQKSLSTKNPSKVVEEKKYVRGEGSIPGKVRTCAYAPQSRPNIF